MNIKSLNKELKKITKTVDNIFDLNKDVDEIVKRYTDIDDKIIDLQNKGVADDEKNTLKAEKKNERMQKILSKRKEKEDKIKAKGELSKAKTKSDIEKKQKVKKVDIEKVEDSEVKSSYSTKVASKEIVTLFNAMTQRKEINNNVRSIPISLKKQGRYSIMIVDEEEVLRLNVDGNGRLTLRLIDTTHSRNVFRFIILPLLSVLNEYFNGNISISNNKNIEKVMSMNINKMIYVSSDQIKNKPVKMGQIINFTNLVHGKFNITQGR